LKVKKELNIVSCQRKYYDMSTKRSLLILFSFILILISCENTREKENRISEHESIRSITDSISIKKPIINVFIENSLSMDGYVKGKTDFETAVYSFLSDIKISKITNSLNLNYINSVVLSQPDDLADFIEKLEPASFKMKGGDRNVTDISNIIETILDSTKDNTISVFVSDCVFSPGTNDNGDPKNADEYLDGQQIGIKEDIANKIDENDFAIIVYRLTSRFFGNYYNKFDESTSIDDQRPFYIWILGDQSQLKELIDKVPKDDVKGEGVQFTYTAFNKNKNINYAILNSPRIGTFERIDKYSIKKAKKDKDRKEFTFSIGVDYSSMLLDDLYLRNPNNYVISDPNYTLEVIKTNKSKYSHTIRLTTKSKIISSTNITIKLKHILPTWIEEYNDEIGEDINADGAMNKTYGIKYLIGGVYDAYTKDDAVWAEFKITINQ
jgi:hypothetical protein